ncbi:MAG TPA: flagellar basal body M-ring protein FliF [Sedimenticola thiotaurini]|uniref:Flagellar M-ring protein n=1 Tax=Sedimenticola thiotaurini TaxID=1543721 RepID=A0A831RNL5_9GAMM|nr:flagellar basal body M-ring protein FliF [Sedimenticola thiotaurini]
MEVVNADNPATGQLTVQSLGRNPIVRQLAVMIGIAASVALGVAVVLWSQTPNYSLLFGNLAPKDATEIVAALQQAGIDYKVDENTGAVMVPSASVQQARMKLAGAGLPRSNSIGYELLEKETGFGTSRALEKARFHRALEGELARTIASLANIESARVHLATPRQSVFVRKQKKPSASVVVNLYPGRTLEKQQVAAIIHLVASSVPELEAGRVTVVDNRGRMLNGPRDSLEMSLTSSQFDYTKQLEEHYRERVTGILEPILGIDNVRAQVTAVVDFTVTEQTEERFNPDLPALRSEQVDEQATTESPVQGIPGALSNQPPAAGTAPEQAVAGNNGDGTAPPAPVNTSKRATRNYELDKTISHTRLSTGQLRQLSVAVVVDDRVEQGADGAVIRTPRTPEEISRITELVKKAIGFDATRGDSVQVINAAFMAPPQAEPLPEPPLWEQPWVWDLAKQVGGILLVLLLILFVLRPTMKRLTAPPVIERIDGEAGDGDGGEAGEGAGAQGEGGGTHGLEKKGLDALGLPGPEDYEQTLEAARQMVEEDPKRVAQVVKNWVAEDGG